MLVRHMTPPITPPMTSSPDNRNVCETGNRHGAMPGPNMSEVASQVSSSMTSLASQVARLTELSEKTAIAAVHPGELGVGHASITLVTQDYLEYIKGAMLVLGDLDAEDDVQFSLENSQLLPLVETSVHQFDGKIAEYRTMVESILLRDNLTQTHVADLNNLLAEVNQQWRELTELVRRIRDQTYVANDWQDCLSSLEGIQMELKELEASIYLVEEQRHVIVPVTSVELDILATILEEAPEGENTGTPGKKTHSDKLSQWDRIRSETVMRLASRIAPLRTSIRMFGPRLESFASRAAMQFPAAIKELKARYSNLQSQFENVVNDFQKLRRELGEDKWMAVFRQVNKQATEMMNSLQRTCTKLHAVSFADESAVDLAESFVMKADHYGKAIPSILSIMQRGVRDRLTLNGEVIRGYDLLTQRWAQLSIEIADMTRKVYGVNGKLQTSLTSSTTKPPQRLIVGSKNPTSPRRRLAKADQTTPAADSRHILKPSHRLNTATPVRLSRSTYSASPSRTCSASPTTFRKDISMDPPRSRSRLSNVIVAKSPSPARPPWNSGTVARLSEENLPRGTSMSMTPSRSSSRSSNTRSGIHSSLSMARSQTPSQEIGRRSLGSSIPLKSPHKSLQPKLIPLVPPVPKTPSMETIERLSKPRIPVLAATTSRLPVPPMTPVSLRSSLPVPKTPGSVSISRRIISNPEIQVASQVSQNLSSGPSGMSTAYQPPRPRSALSRSRQSGIPIMSPQKPIRRS